MNSVNRGRSGERLTFARSDGRHFQIGPIALETLLGYAQDEPFKPEAGGVLLGRHLLDTRDVVVDRVTTPQPGDRQARLRFFRACRRHQRLIDRAWVESGGTCTYLGEWHTHPEPNPTPSWIDSLDWRRKLAFDRYTEPIFFVIVGTAEMRAWEGRRYGHLAALRRIEER
ncbi:MAG: Mov34/MPN/PAD-1 family protein [Thermomicrobiales bacterium]